MEKITPKKKALLAFAAFLVVAYAIPTGVSLSSRLHILNFPWVGLIRTYDSNLPHETLSEASFREAEMLYNGGINGLSLMPDYLIVRRVEIDYVKIKTYPNGEEYLESAHYRQYTFFNIPVGTRTKYNA